MQPIGPRCLPSLPAIDYRSALKYAQKITVIATPILATISLFAAGIIKIVAPNAVYGHALAASGGIAFVLGAPELLLINAVALFVIHFSMKNQEPNP